MPVKNFSIKIESILFFLVIFLVNAMKSYCITPRVTRQADSCGPQLEVILPAFSDFARDQKRGHVILMSYEEAEKYCHDQGLRLPNPRELALLAQSRGALGIHGFDSSQRNEVSSFKPIFYTTAAGGEPDFYYSSEGYQAPEGVDHRWLEGVGMWSSQTNAGGQERDYRDQGAFVLIYATGEIIFETFPYSIMQYSVRCVPQ